ncbi:hypothetical protein [Formosa algae]|uniref:Outer membrane protein beta-barrel domain-containing protein n=1 Tax=Formosa algae TaxID=225843 RepID=A0A9X1CCT0_9FLAO|nr:hypothetical protein [Formosa algae]MBP1840454.1 hypothetical protein [Formosa algae]MDQ0336946.1 hypothetical protein [Formosa algae]OEI80833.1 hypothetical protein AST99_07215 [Formosa algae]PNW28167.1 hypothetical protein BKP44_09840 [Formosa algae]
MKNILLFFILLQFAAYSTYAQEHEDNQDTEMEFEESETFEHHQIGAMIGHAHIYQGHHAEGKDWLVVPMVSLNYNYWINETWGVGLHTDFILETYEVHEEGEDGEVEILERELPIAPALMAAYKPGEHFTFMLGVGEEFAKEEDLFLIRGEVEYSLELPKAFELGAAIGYDVRFDAYDSWVLALGVSKLF